MSAPERHSDAYDPEPATVPSRADLAWEKERTDEAIEKARGIAWARFVREEPEGAARDPWTCCKPGCCNNEESA